MIAEHTRSTSQRVCFSSCLKSSSQESVRSPRRSRRLVRPCNSATVFCETTQRCPGGWQEDAICAAEGLSAVLSEKFYSVFAPLPDGSIIRIEDHFGSRVASVPEGFAYSMVGKKYISGLH